MFMTFGEYLVSFKAYDLNQIHNKEYTEMSNMSELMRNSIYTSHEFIIDAISYSLDYDNIDTLNLSLDKFDHQASLQPFLIVDIIINKIYLKLKSGKMLHHIDEKLKFLRKLCSTNNSKVSSIIYFKKVVNSMLDMDVHVNTIVNMHNPLKIIVLYIDVFRSLSLLIGQIVGTLDDLFERLEKFAVHLIDQ